jgi:hypothetical protein
MRMSERTIEITIFIFELALANPYPGNLANAFCEGEHKAHERRLERRFFRVRLVFILSGSANTWSRLVRNRVENL